VDRNGQHTIEFHSPKSLTPAEKSRICLRGVAEVMLQVFK
jgi:hypothetical protein